MRRAGRENGRGREQGWKEGEDVKVYREHWLIMIIILVITNTPKHRLRALLQWSNPPIQQQPSSSLDNVCRPGAAALNCLVTEGWKEAGWIDRWI